MNRRIPYAVANYQKIVRDNYYFVDKTRFIHELEKYESPVFIRPRRFGKSLWCTILECYYDINRSTGRSDWEAIGRAGTPFENQAALIEFKHYTKETVAKLGVLDWTEPAPDAVEQVNAYAADLQRDYPDLTITRHVVCTIRAADYRFFHLTGEGNQ